MIEQHNNVFLVCRPCVRRSIRRYFRKLSLSKHDTCIREESRMWSIRRKSHAGSISSENIECFVLVIDISSSTNKIHSGVIIAYEDRLIHVAPTGPHQVIEEGMYSMNEDDDFISASRRDQKIHLLAHKKVILL